MNGKTGNKYSDACTMSVGSRIVEIRLLQTLIRNFNVKIMGVVIAQGNGVSQVSN